MPVYTYNMDGMIGYDLGEKLFEVTSLKNQWNHRDVHRFNINGSQVFDVKVNTEVEKHVRNGTIIFWMKPNRGVAVKYSDVQLLLRRGFADIYNAIEQSQLDWFLDNPNNIYFQIFVLFRFEIARRKKYDDPAFPTCTMTKEAVSMAVHIDDKRTYEILIKMFSERKDRRRYYYCLEQLCKV